MTNANAGAASMQELPVPTETSVSRSRLYARCFLVGGMYGIVSQLLGTVMTSFVGNAFAGPATLLSLGVLAIIMYIPGLHQRIASTSGFGSILPFNGFACGIADAYQAGFAADGSASGGLKAVASLFVRTVVAGGLICMAAGAVGSFVELPRVPVPEALPLPVSLVGAFVVAGAVCLLFQLVTDMGKFAIPNVLLVGLALGGVLTLFGITDWLAAVGGFGFTVLVVGAGQAVTATTELLFLGDPTMLAIVWGVFVALALIGIICAIGNQRR